MNLSPILTWMIEIVSNKNDPITTHLLRISELWTLNLEPISLGVIKNPGQLETRWSSSDRQDCPCCDWPSVGSWWRCQPWSISPNSNRQEFAGKIVRLKAVFTSRRNHNYENDKDITYLQLSCQVKSEKAWRIGIKGGRRILRTGFRY
jgi:hypothetical protein